MKESIYTIPISEVFEPRQGCPVCALHNTLESRCVEYITGAAMMEPDIRQQTNLKGFCSKHFEKMLAKRNKLSVALMVQSRLEHIAAEIQAGYGRPSTLGRKKDAAYNDDCFICDNIQIELARIGENISTLWAKDEDFRRLYADQEFLCYPHYRLLLQKAHGLNKRSYAAFAQASGELTLKRLLSAKDNIDAFCNLFDYRSGGSTKPEPEVTSAVEAAVHYLCGDIDD